MIYQFTPERFLITVMQNIIVMLNEVKHLYRFFADAQNDREIIRMTVVENDMEIIRMTGKPSEWQW